jgi:hypothetical protein
VSKFHAYMDFYTRCLLGCRRLACWRIKSNAFTYLPKLREQASSLRGILCSVYIALYAPCLLAQKSTAFTYLPNCVSKLHAYLDSYDRCILGCRRLACWRIKSVAFTYLSNCVSKLHAYVDFILGVYWVVGALLACWRIKSNAFTYLPNCVSKLRAYAGIYTYFRISSVFTPYLSQL